MLPQDEHCFIGDVILVLHSLLTFVEIGYSADQLLRISWPRCGYRCIDIAWWIHDHSIMHHIHRCVSTPGCTGFVMQGTDHSEKVIAIESPTFSISECDHHSAFKHVLDWIFE